MRVIIKYITILLMMLVCISPSLAYQQLFQGDEVYINETVDISTATGWAGSLAYWDGYGYDMEVIPYVLELPGKIRSPNLSSQYRFYIDPEIFNSRLGYWYAWYGKAEDHGNNIAFVVRKGERPIINETLNETNETKNITIFNPPPVSPQHVSDYLVARGDSLDINTDGLSRVWIFGNNDGLYNLRSTNGSVKLNISMINNLRVGEYTIFIHKPGDDGEFNVIYDNNKKLLNVLYSVEENFDIKEYDMSGSDQYGFKTKLVEEIGKTNDSYTTKKLVIEDPIIDIIARDNIEVGKVELMQVKGYTNVAKDTEICFNIDEEIVIKSLQYKPICIKAEGDEIGYRRYFIASIPFSYNDLSVGEHFITGTTSIGGSQTVSFNVYSTFDDKPVNVTTKYISGNEFKPTPTPEIIKVVETKEIKVIETQIVVQQLTPDLNQLYETNKKVQDDTLIQIFEYGILIFAILYVISVMVRGRRD